MLWEQNLCDIEQPVFHPIKTHNVPKIILTKSKHDKMYIGDVVQVENELRQIHATILTCPTQFTYTYATVLTNSQNIYTYTDFDRADRNTYMEQNLMGIT